MTTNSYYQLFASCIPVKGAMRSTICDLQRQTFDIIPNIIFEILTEHKDKTVDDIIEHYGEAHRETICDYFEFLIQNDYVFWCSHDELSRFPEMNMIWETPFEITNAIIDRDKNSTHDFPDIIQQLSDLGCGHIQIRIFDAVSWTDIVVIIAALSKTRVKSAELIVPFQTNFNLSTLEKALATEPRIQSVIFFAAPEDKTITSGMSVISFTTAIISDATHCGVVSPDFFAVNTSLFTESQKHNSCLNRKIGVDVNGEIKNCPSMLQSFGNVAEVSLKKALESEGFKTLWSIHKDEIETCKDCEFRYVCTDCRAFVNDLHDKPTKCNYDPYTAKWTETEKEDEPILFP